MTTKQTPAPRKAAAKWHNSVAEAAQSGDSMAALVALRDTLAQAIDGVGAKRDLAALSRQLTDVLAKIDAHRPAVRTPADELKAKRAKRQAMAAAPAKLAEVTPMSAAALTKPRPKEGRSVTSFSDPRPAREGRVMSADIRFGDGIYISIAAAAVMVDTTTLAEKLLFRQNGQPLPAAVRDIRDQLSGSVTGAPQPSQNRAPSRGSVPHVGHAVAAVIRPSAASGPGSSRFTSIGATRRRGGLIRSRPGTSKSMVSMSRMRGASIRAQPSIGLRERSTEHN